MSSMPSEFAISGMYVPPLLVVGFLATLAAIVTAQLLNRYRLSRYFFYPPLVFLALAVIYGGLIGIFLIKVVA